jgi:hypothetical protein
MTTQLDDIQKDQVVFLSSIVNLRIVRVPSRRRYNERGELEMLPGEAYEFADGLLKVDDPEVADWLRKHPKFNTKFVEVGNEPGRIKPELPDVLSAISAAAARGDLPTLVKIYDEEKSTHERETVLTSAQSAIEALETLNVNAQSEGTEAPEPVAVAEGGESEE